MNPAGTLQIRAAFTDGSVRIDAVVLERPAMTRLFVGQNPDAAVRLVPHLYALCAEAQRFTAQAALAVADGRQFERSALDDRLLWLEMLHENLWRLLLDWPVACGLVPARDEFAAWRSARLGVDGLAATRRLIDETLCPLVEKCRKTLVDRNIAPNWPTPDPAAWLVWWQAGGSSPQVPPRPPAPNDIAAAWLARIADVARAAAALEASQPFPLVAAGGDGVGVAQSVTARGILTHAIAIEQGKVKRYHLEAPTDACFAGPQALAALLAGRCFESAGAARIGLETAILALDPCLPYEVEWKDA
ncbi:hypothetical protein BJN45_12965 [Azonexus hydrophilus]|uniref:Ni,Fe-hydrogenase I large subunit n=1 Tax=Azonexus hydrophilus TaxID=418702 RepID=A0A1R1I363_9RHOO|nr:hypothetical protein [Azonexus hydrophilus]OMG53137.1 hypothetical protein BJN45_12965 [Azonexus hydrophilus]